MTRKMSTLRALFSSVAVLVLSLSIFADTIRLKDGSIIKGTIVGFSNGRFTIAVGEGARRRELTLFADEIVSIEFDSQRQSASLNNRNRQDSDAAIVPTSTRPSPKVVTTDPSEDPSDQAAKHKVVVTDTTKSDIPKTSSQPRETSSSLPPQQNTTAAKPVSKPAINRPVPAGASSTTSPVTVNVRVLADNTANGWTNSGYVVKKGQRIRISADGTVSLGKGISSNPSGLPDVDDSGKLLKMVPTGALVAVIGDDNNDFIYIGGTREFTAGRDGALYLGVNEGNLNDNSGAYNVKVEILPSDN